jgi:hypothetical protein
MTQVNYSEQLTNGTEGEAPEVMIMFNELKAGANAVDDTNIGPAGISESKIIFSTSGHNHNGVNSALGALAVNGGAQGTIKVRRVVAAAMADATFSSNLNPAGATAINTILAVNVMMNSGAASGDGHAFHTGAGLPGTVTLLNSYTSRYGGGSTANTIFGWYVIVNVSTTPNEVFIYNDNMTAATVTPIVSLLGI